MLRVAHPLPFSAQEVGSTLHNWDMKKDGSRLIMCIILLFEEFLVRDASLPRAKLDAGQMNSFWDEFSVAFISDNQGLQQGRAGPGGLGPKPEFPVPDSCTGPSLHCPRPPGSARPC